MALMSAQFLWETLTALILKVITAQEEKEFGDSSLWSYVIPKLTGWSFLSVYVTSGYEANCRFIGPGHQWAVEPCDYYSFLINKINFRKRDTLSGKNSLMEPLILLIVLAAESPLHAKTLSSFYLSLNIIYSNGYPAISTR